MQAFLQFSQTLPAIELWHIDIQEYYIWQWDSPVFQAIYRFPPISGGKTLGIGFVFQQRIH